MNKVVLIGRLARNPDVRYSAGVNSICIARYTLAVNRRYRNQDGSVDADFISCVAFGKNGEFAEKYLKKGMKVAVSGRIQTGSYEKDGRKIYTTEVVIEEHEFCEGKGSGNGSNTSAAVAAGASVDEDGFMDVPDGFDEELPFV